MWLWSYDGDFCVLRELYDGAGVLWPVLLPAALHDIIDAVDEFWRDVGKALRCRFSTDVGRGGDDGLLETVTELLGHLFMGDTHGYAAILGQEARRQVLALVEDDGKRLVIAIHQVPCHSRYACHIRRKTVGRVYQADERLAVGALLYLIYPLYGSCVGGIAPYAPDGVGRV